MKPLSLFLVALLWLCASASGQTIYYVSDTAGNDANLGTSVNTAFATIQHAADVATAGSTVLVMGGVYAEKITTYTHSGADTAPIVFKPYNGASVTIDGGGATTTPGSALWALQDVDYITIDSFDFSNQIGSFVKGILVGKGCDGVTVTNCRFGGIHFSDIPNDTPSAAGDNASPLIAYGTSATEPITNLVFSHNYISNCRTGFSESMTFTGNVDGFRAYDNHLFDNKNIGIDAAGHNGVCPDTALDAARNGVISYNILLNCESPVSTSGQIYVDGGRDIVVERNYIGYGNVGISLGCEIYGYSTSNIKVRNNWIFRQSRTGIEVNRSDTGVAFGRVTNCEISGNTLYSNGGSNVYAGEINIVYAEGLKTHSNILYAENVNNTVLNYHGNNGAGNTMNYNLFYSASGAGNSTFMYDGAGYGSFAAYQASSGQDANSIFADPLMVDVTTSEFHLDTLSPAINAGDPQYMAAAGELDIDSQARMNGIMDCGADETYYPTLSVVAASAARGFRLFPNPAQDCLSLALPASASPYSAPAAFNLTDATGRILWSGMLQPSSSPALIDICGLAPGIYLLTVQQGKEVQTARFVKR